MSRARHSADEVPAAGALVELGDRSCEGGALLSLLHERTMCALGDAAAMPVRAMIKHFRSEFVYHVEHKTCQVAASV